MKNIFVQIELHLFGNGQIYYYDRYSVNSVHDYYFQIPFFKLKK